MEPNLHYQFISPVHLILVYEMQIPSLPLVMTDWRNGSAFDSNPLRISV